MIFIVIIDLYDRWNLSYCMLDIILLFYDVYLCLFMFDILLSP